VENKVIIIQKEMQIDMEYAMTVLYACQKKNSQLTLKPRNDLRIALLQKKTCELVNAMIFEKIIDD
jgi:hypothetical protein